MDYQAVLDAAAQHFEESLPLIPMYIHLILSALFPIYAGAHASLSRPSSAAKPAKKAGESPNADDEEDAVQKMEGLTPQDAVVFPVTAAVVLAGLYFLIKRYGADIVNLILGWYFACVGVYSVGRLINDATNVIVSLVSPTYFARNGNLFEVDWQNGKVVAHSETTDAVHEPVTNAQLPVHPSVGLWGLPTALKRKYTAKLYIHDVVDFKSNVTCINVISAVLGAITIAYANLIDKSWWLTNLQGFAVCYSAMQFMSPTSFTTGSLILGGLFCYDIWAVFFTPLMVTVAKNLDAPVKMVFPRPDEPSKMPDKPPVKSFSMLGLGDIVLPGIIIGLALRFDLYMYYLRKQKIRQATDDLSNQCTDTERVEKAQYVPMRVNLGDRLWTAQLPASSKPAKLGFSFPKVYFTASMIGYVIGMLATLGVMSVFHHAQPALLYLVPGVLVSLWGTGIARGEVKQMWEFTEAVTGEQLDEEQKKDDKDVHKDADKEVDKDADKEVNKDADQEVNKEVEEVDEPTWYQSLKEGLSGWRERDKIGTTKASTQVEKRSDEDDAKSKLEDNSLLIVFSVSRYQPKVAQGPAQISKKVEEENSAPSDSSLGDPILVENDEA